MSEEMALTAEELARQAQQYLLSLKAAGVEWLPLAPLEPVSAQTRFSPSVLPTQVPSVNLPASDQPSSSPACPTLDERRQALTLLAQRVSTCTRCPALVSTRSQTVFGDGQAGVELCFVGEAPGADEDAQGLPFVGAAGQLLNRMIVACGLRRNDVYICNTLKCRPPGNRPPTVVEMANCREFLERQLELVAPRFICALGGSAAKALLNTTQSMGQLRKRFLDYKGIPVLCTYHPAYLLPHRHPEMKREVWEDLKLLLTRMGRPIPVVDRYKLGGRAMD
jgi:DNA polymerase